MKQSLYATALFLIVASNNVDATTIVAFLFKGMIVIGADGVSSTDPGTTEHPCKIADNSAPGRPASILIAVSGLTILRSAQFEARVDVGRAADGQTSAIASMARFQQTFQPMLPSLVAAAQSHPDYRRWTLRGEPVLEVFFASDGEASICAFRVDPNGNAIDPLCETAVGKPGRLHQFFMGRTQTLRAQLKGFSEAQVSDLLVFDAARFVQSLILIEFAAPRSSEQPVVFGTPVSVAAVTANGVSWPIPGTCQVTRQGMAPR